MKTFGLASQYFIFPVFCFVRDTNTSTVIAVTFLHINPFDTIGVSVTPSPPWLIFELKEPLKIILSPEMRFQKDRKVAHFLHPSLKWD